LTAEQAAARACFRAGAPAQQRIGTMAQITAQMVKDLRDMTGAGMMDCKAALGESSGNVDAAVDWLRKKGLSKAAKKADRVAAEGLIGVAVNGAKGVGWVSVTVGGAWLATAPSKKS